MSPTSLSYVAAVLAACTYGAASVLQASGARRAKGAGGGTVSLARQPRYLAGLVLDGVAWLLSLLALRRLPLFAVQATLAGSVGVTVVLARVALGERLRRVDGAAVVASMLALVVLGLAAGPEGVTPPSRALQMTFLAAAPGVALAAVVAARRSVPVVLGAVAGLAYGGTAMSARALDVSGSLAHVATRPLAVALVAFGVTGTLAYAAALDRAEVGPVTAALWVVEVVVPAAVGVAALGDHVRPGWAGPDVAAVAVALAATVVLAWSPAQVAG